MTLCQSGSTHITLTCFCFVAADRFVEYYYEALNRNLRGGPAHTHQDLSQFYVSTSARLTGAGLKPDISINGHVCSAVSELQELLEKQGTPIHYDVQSVDAHPVNPHYVLGSTDPEVQNDKGDKMSFSVQVGGTIKFNRGDEATIKGFNDAFVLVPHWEAQGRNAPRGLRRWVVVSQNSRHL
ncbi:nuclear transport factor 2 domain-containing protein [Seiridium cupressi]